MSIVITSSRARDLRRSCEAKHMTYLAQTGAIEPYSKGDGRGINFRYTPFNMFQFYIHDCLMAFDIMRNTRGRIVYLIGKNWKDQIEGQIIGKRSIIQAADIRIFDGKFMDVARYDSLVQSVRCNNFPTIFFDGVSKDSQYTDALKTDADSALVIKLTDGVLCIRNMLKVFTKDLEDPNTEKLLF